MFLKTNLLFTWNDIKKNYWTTTENIYGLTKYYSALSNWNGKKVQGAKKADRLAVINGLTYMRTVHMKNKIYFVWDKDVI